MIAHLYSYQITSIIEVHDGDTVIANTDLGFGLTAKVKYRLSGINAPELAAPGGIEARDFLSGLLSAVGSDTVTVKSTKDKYGRYLGQFTIGGVDVNQKMVDSGHAVPYPSSKPKGE